MTTLDEMIEQARQGYASLGDLVRSGTVSSTEAAKVSKALDALMAPVLLLESLEAFEVGEMDARSRRFRASGVLRHDQCGRAYADDEDREDLGSLLGLAASHECPALPENPGAPSELERAAQAFQAAYRAAVGLNIFDEKTGRVARTAQDYMIALAKDERDKVAGEHEGSGEGQTPVLEALERVVERMESHHIVS